MSASRASRGARERTVLLQEKPTIRTCSATTGPQPARRPSTRETDEIGLFNNLRWEPVFSLPETQDPVNLHRTGTDTALSANETLESEAPVSAPAVARLREAHHSEGYLDNRRLPFVHEPSEPTQRRSLEAWRILFRQEAPTLSTRGRRHDVPGPTFPPTTDRSAAFTGRVADLSPSRKRRVAIPSATAPRAPCSASRPPRRSCCVPSRAAWR